jgi:hypothetical protein
MALFKVIADRGADVRKPENMYNKYYQSISYSRISLDLIVAEQDQPQGSNGSSWSYVAFA